MKINPTAEERTRLLFGHAIRGEYDDFSTSSWHSRTTSRCKARCSTVAIAGYVIVDDNAGQRPSEDAVRLPFIISALLLGSAEEVGDDHHWWAYLDEVEAAIEAAPDPS